MADAAVFPLANRLAVAAIRAVSPFEPRPYHPSSPADPLPRPRVDRSKTGNLIENIERLKLPVDRFLPLHGRVVPLADLYTTAGRTPPK